MAEREQNSEIMTERAGLRQNNSLKVEHLHPIIRRIPTSTPLQLTLMTQMFSSPVIQLYKLIMRHALIWDNLSL